MLIALFLAWAAMAAATRGWAWPTPGTLLYMSLREERRQGGWS